MSISHRTNRLKLKGIPSVEKLQNGRYKLTVECSTMNSREDWYSANKARIFPDFGSLQSAEMSIDGLEPRTGEAYTDMRLTEVQSGSRSVRDGGDYLVVLTYETLGSSFVQVKDDTVNYIENGLRRVTRKSIAEVGTDFQKTIGTTSITSQIDDEIAVTCILANYEVNDTDSYREVTEVYIQAGIISVSQEFTVSRDKITVRAFKKTSTEVTTALSEVTANHKLIEETEDDFDGIKTSSYTYELDSFDVVETDENGLETTTRSAITATKPSLIVGTTKLNPTADPEDGIVLAKFSINEGKTFFSSKQVYSKEGNISVRTTTGPQGLPSTYTRTYSSRMLEPTSLGIAISKEVSNTAGYKTYEYRFLEGSTQGTSPLGTGGEIVSYSENVEVRNAGVVSAFTTTVADGTGTGTIASLSVVPPSIKTVQATVSIKLVTGSTVSVPVAYNLSDRSCSAVILTSKKSPIGIEQGASLKITVFNHSHSQQSRSFPNSYYSGTNATGTLSTPASIIRDDDNIIGESTKETVDTSVTFSGSSTAPATSGLYQEDIEPAFLDADGTQYYRKTSYTI